MQLFGMDHVQHKIKKILNFFLKKVERTHNLVENTIINKIIYCYGSVAVFIQNDGSLEGIFE